LDEDGSPLTADSELKVWIGKRPAVLRGSKVLASFGEKKESVEVIAAIGGFA